MRNVEVTDACWLWQGALTAEGYPKKAVHRRIYKLMVGPIPAGHDLDHLCSVRRCVNPEHLEPVLNVVNIARAVAGRTTCRNGHPRPVGPYRRCMECQRQASRRYRARIG
jgi:hypothetical protein